MIGKGRLPSYLIRNIRKLYPSIGIYPASQFTSQMSYIKIPKAEIVYSDEKLYKSAW